MYFIWALLPFILLMMAIWAWLKPILKVHGKEDGKRFFIMFLCCAFTLWLSILIDRSLTFKELIPKVTFGFISYEIAAWMVYPAMLYFGTFAWDYYDKSKKKK